MYICSGREGERGDVRIDLGCYQSGFTLQIYRPATDDYMYYDKFFGRSVTEDSALEGRNQ